MKTYQTAVLDAIEQTANDTAEIVSVSVSHNFANIGRVVAHGSKLRTLATIDFDFQSDRVRATLNGDRPGQPVSGPRSDTIFHWVIGSPDDDSEITRLLRLWREAIESKLV